MNDNAKAFLYWNNIFSIFNKGSDLHEQKRNILNQAELPVDLLDQHRPLGELIKQYPKVNLDQNKLIQQLEEQESELESIPTKNELVESELNENKLNEKNKKPQKLASLNDIIEDLKLKIFILDLKLIQELFAENYREAISSSDLINWRDSSSQWNERLNNMGHGPSTGFKLSNEEIAHLLANLETKMIKKMKIRELLKDDELVVKINPTMAIVEELLYEKDQIDGEILNRARVLIKRFVDQLAEVLKNKVNQSIRKIPNPEIPPKKVLRNLDVKKTIWKNLHNWDPNSNKLFINNMHYLQATKKTTATDIIVVVDQSGSMTDAMVQCTILASIFVGLPNVNVKLFAFDTKVIDLTKYVHDPFEVLLNTHLGGGTYINLALLEASKEITKPKDTALVLITDYYEGGSEDVLYNTIMNIKNNGTTIISVGSLDKRGKVFINSRFVNKLKQTGIKTIIGGPEDLIDQIKVML
ncbi:MAG: VWA domain-containing protein [Candidatus Heimdallarchaeota archaeon]|nr:VWA domain-containing protein [Candidatus Heimdallarchaeota archaeon]